MESQLHRTYGRDYDDRLHPAGAVVHRDEADNVNDSAVVRSGLAEPTVMGTPVLAENMDATRSNVAEPPMRPSTQWEEMYYAQPPPATGCETHLTNVATGGHYTLNREPFKGGFGNPTGFEDDIYDAPPPLSTGYENPPYVGHDYGYGQDIDREPLKGRAGNTTGSDESGGVYVTHPGGDHVYSKEHLYTEDPVGTRKSTAIEGEKEVGITGVLHSLDKMKIFDEHDNKPKSDQTEAEVYTGSHDQFAPEPVSKPPLDTIAANPSNPNSSYTQIISSATSALADKAGAVKDSIVSKLSSSDENKTEVGTTSPKTSTKSSFPTAFSHKVADTLSSTLGPVYDKLSSKTPGSGHDEGVGSPGKGVTVKEFLVDTFKPGDDDKVLSEAITHAFHRGKGNQPTQETTTTTYVVRPEEEERRLQESGN